MKSLQTEYEISPATLAIIPDRNDFGVSGSLVIEKQNDFFVPVTPKKLIDQACKFFGSSLKGRLEGTKDICGYTHKPPIAIDPYSGMYFFPTTSPQNPECSWLAHSYIDRVKPSPENQSFVYFVNGKHVAFPVSYGSMINQIQRTAQLRYKLTERLQYRLQPESAKVAEPYA